MTDRAGAYTEEEPSLIQGRTRVFPIGAEAGPDAGIDFSVWAPNVRRVTLELSENVKVAAEADSVELEPTGNGYFGGTVKGGHPGMYYRFRLDQGAFPDPASRFQPEGPHGPSQIIDPRLFAWTDQEWAGVSAVGQVIYEMHIGTFTPSGTWAAAAAELPRLKDLEITLIEMMPVADFPGRFGWGYDGVNLFAPTRLYGTPEDLRGFVNQAHRLGLGVILDVVYNHLGPDGNYLKNFSEDYFTDRYSNEWGQAINFDGPNSGPVREFFLTNAAYWIEEFHFDGLRLDATQQMFDASPTHILADLGQRVRQAAPHRRTYLVSENEPQQARLARPLDLGGYGMNALWNDDFHHSAKVALTGRNEAYYSDYRGTPQELISAVKRGFLFQGQWFSWQKKRRGSPAFDLAPEQFVNFLQNHDQVANSLGGLRLHRLTSPGRFRAMTALLLLGPATPMLFQGQEFAASSPFLFFADHNPELASLVAKGRREFLSQFPSIANQASASFLATPHAERTFLDCKLELRERETNAEVYRLHRDLLKLRKDDPVFASPRARSVDGAVLANEAFALRFFGPAGEDRLLIVNLGVDLKLSQLAEPLLAPPEGKSWGLLWSSESPIYGGSGAPSAETDGVWRIPGHATLVLSSNSGRPNATGESARE